MGENLKTVELKLRSIEWMLPYVQLSIAERIKMLENLDDGKNIDVGFRSWSLETYPRLPASQRIKWTVKSSFASEKPRATEVSLAFCIIPRTQRSGEREIYFPSGAVLATQLGARPESVGLRGDVCGLRVYYKTFVIPSRQLGPATDAPLERDGWQEKQEQFSQVVASCRKLSQVVSSSRKLSQVIASRRRLLQVDAGRRRLSQVVASSCKLSQLFAGSRRVPPTQSTSSSSSLHDITCTLVERERSHMSGCLMWQLLGLTAAHELTTGRALLRLPHVAAPGSYCRPRADHRLGSVELLGLTADHELTTGWALLRLPHVAAHGSYCRPRADHRLGSVEVASCGSAWVLLQLT
ncbi:hypothetical protein PR048_007312 [Dryococelus australis]|uniref:Double jelly roll-like domain-containing protein n=1 Tax=Dryococelus australis TaxID=614101 RepID=A0ABQ9IDA5_9NEOP|nr:hypothetical protein PR048_007312 [Dryococelus australis]